MSPVLLGLGIGIAAGLVILFAVAIIKWAIGKLFMSGMGM